MVNERNYDTKASSSGAISTDDLLRKTTASVAEALIRLGNSREECPATADLCQSSTTHRSKRKRAASVVSISSIASSTQSPDDDDSDGSSCADQPAKRLKSMAIPCLGPLSPAKLRSPALMKPSLYEPILRPETRQKFRIEYRNFYETKIKKEETNHSYLGSAALAKPMVFRPRMPNRIVVPPPPPTSTTMAKRPPPMSPLAMHATTRIPSHRITIARPASSYSNEKIRPLFLHSEKVTERRKFIVVNSYTIIPNN